MRIALIGTGVIGAGWAARCLAHGFDVLAWDPAPNAEQNLRAKILNAWPALTRQGLAEGADPARLQFVADLEDAVRDADFIQESAPEVEDLKRSLLARVDAAARPNVVIASSSSGLLPTRFQADCRHPGRVLVGHPFNPVYLLPLVEVLGGAATDAAALDEATAFYRRIGMRPLRVRTEIPGYISDRLQEALWREILHMVAEGVATTDELDDAIRFGPGLRWSFMGTCLIFHMAGGDAGMRHMLEQFGPALKLPWTKLEAPELTDELIDRMVAGTMAQAGGRSVAELERYRDDALISVMETLAAVKARHGMAPDA
ncbi:MAG: L-carnitine dehydrogenase [Rhodospirillales bacterium]